MRTKAGIVCVYFYATANFAPIEAYWHIGKNIVEKQDDETRAECKN